MKDPASLRPSKSVWIELIAFDAEADDLGVDAVLDDMGETPVVLSLLLYTVDFVMLHDADAAGVLPAASCSYAARPLSMRGPRQDWTRGALRRLVVLLQARGIAVGFAMFDLHHHRIDGELRSGVWASRHPELFVTTADGVVDDVMINPLARYDDGELFGTHFSARVREVIEYYGFDVFHAADGITSGRLALWDGDWSAGMLADFSTFLGPTRAGSVTLTSTWVWEHARTEWRQFHIERWSTFWGELVRSVRDSGARLILNNAWTQDPVEAMWRYGVDYRRLVAAGADTFLLETSAAAVELLEDPAEAPLAGHLATTMLMGAVVPDASLIGLIGVRDTYEEWDVVRTAPAMLERDLRLLFSTRRRNGDQSWTCLSGAMYCLGDGLSHAEWSWLDGILGSVGLTSLPTDVAVVVDPSSIDLEVASLDGSRAATSQRLIADLLRRGAGVSEVITLGDAAGRDARLDAAVLFRAENAAPGSVDALSERCRRLVVVSFDSTCRDSGEWRVRQYIDGAIVHEAQENGVVRGGDELPRGRGSWLQPVPMSFPAERLWTSIVEHIRPAASPVLDDAAAPALRGVIARRGARVADVVVHNQTRRFQEAALRLPDGGAASRLGASPGDLPVRVEGDIVQLRVPPSGVVAVQMREGAADAD